VAIQLGVSFGHVHRIDPLRQAGLWSQAASTTDSQSATDESTPASKPVGSAFEFCALCVVVKMGAAMMPAQAPASFGPAIISQIQFLPRADAAPPGSPHRSFEARGPPFA
jgi:hypothetical protein